MSLKVLVLGGGEIASGIIYRLHQIGCKLLITELQKPLCVRRTVSFSEAVYEDVHEIEGVRAELIKNSSQIEEAFLKGSIPIIIDPAGTSEIMFYPDIIIDARMLKHDNQRKLTQEPFIIGLGPGFIAGKNCHVVIETNRGHFLGRIYWEGHAEEDTGIPEGVNGMRSERVLRAPASGSYQGIACIGTLLEKDEIIGEIGETKIYAPFKGLLRGIIHSGVEVNVGTKIGDLDPRCDPRYLHLISDKALAIGGAVVTAIISQKPLREKLVLE